MRRVARFPAFILLCMSMLGAAPASTTAPSSIEQRFNELADADPARRESAKEVLMGLDRAGLEQLRAVAQATRPLLPAQAAALRDIVVQAYLGGETYDREPGIGFLGVQWVAADADQAGNAPTPAPVVVMQRLPGFCAYRMLRDGDVILTILEQPGQPLREEFARIVGSSRAGTTLTFEVLRQGQVIRVPITLDPRPVEAGNRLTMDEFLFRRLRNAEEYWQQAFGSLLEEGMS